MPRPRSIPDARIHAAVRAALATGGEKAVSFGAIARATGLAPSTLVQRFGSVAAMQTQAVRDGWLVLTDATEAALAGASGKGPQGLLKALDAIASEVPGLLQATTDDAGRALATDWRLMVEAALAHRIGQGDKSRDAAAILFAAWQGQLMWRSDSFRLKDAVKRLG